MLPPNKGAATNKIIPATIKKSGLALIIIEQEDDDKEAFRPYIVIISSCFFLRLSLLVVVFL
jgi:hypothetical protein